MSVCVCELSLVADRVIAFDEEAYSLGMMVSAYVCLYAYVCMYVCLCTMYLCSSTLVVNRTCHLYMYVCTCISSFGVS